MIPCLKRLKRFFGDENGAKIRRLLEGKDKPEQYERVQKYIKQCYSEPNGQHDELTLIAIDEIIDGFGIEPIRGRHVDNYFYDCQAVFVNTGGTYSATILRDNETGRLHATTLGDWVESHNNRGII